MPDKRPAVPILDSDKPALPMDTHDEVEAIKAAQRKRNHARATLEDIALERRLIGKDLW